jgi:glycosyltransferase involved in cell wall biosynthesis
MPHICIDCRYIGPRPSGIGMVVRGLIEHLPALAPDWHFTLLRNPRLSGALSLAHNVTEIDVAAPANGPATMWWLGRIVNFAGIDLLHAPANILPRGLPVPAVTTVHDVMWLTNPEWCRQGVRGLVERQFYGGGIRRALAQSRAITTVSEATRQAIIALHPSLAGRVFSCLSGVDAAFRPLRHAAADTARLGLPGNAFVLCVGQNAPYKNHANALRGFALAFADRPDIHLVMVQRRDAGGPGLDLLARDLGLAGRVHFPEPVSTADLVAFYNAASALLHPSLCEGFGNPLAEAMACGTPVVTSNLSAMPEVTGGAALLVDPRDPASIAEALRRILDEPGLAARLREKGLARAKALDWRRFAAEHLAVYRAAINSD